ncbi:glutathione S-transferase T1-like [Andrographis paniculata]|uniref:glutathione S-transferase T1-like n=1 Tax=Andrographis paniculata TaxID=175694 RepID=UPI0021E7994D|nr:glutathione S-transferase T1-like [Andrographis paniculata]
MSLKLYVDRISQPSRALVIFCKVNGIEFEEVKIDLTKKQHHSPEYAEINPMKQVPAIVHDDLKLFESHTILGYLASAFPVADHWYPSDIRKRAKVQLVLDWHHSNLRRGSVSYIFNTLIALAVGAPINLSAAAKGEKLMLASFTTIESFWLEEDKPFLHGSAQPSIADLSLVCEIMQLEFAEESERERLLGPHKRILKWIEDTKTATAPYFDEVHAVIAPIREKLQGLKAQLGK